MKQHITLKQLKEITNYYFLKLYLLVRPNTNKSTRQILGYYKAIMSGYGFGPNKLLSEITIGKMIEILEEKYQVTIDGNYNSDLWSVVLYKKNSKSFAFDFHSCKKCLSNALWEAVKFVLGE